MWFIKQLGGFSLGILAAFVVFLAIYGRKDEGPQAVVEPKNVVVASGEVLAPEQGVKTIVNKFTEARIYAADGSYFLATLEQYIEFNKGDDVSSNNWRMPEHPPNTPGVLPRDSDK